MNKNNLPSFPPWRRAAGYYAAAFLAGAVIASVFWQLRNQATIRAIARDVKPLRQNNGSYTYINPLLGYELPDDVKEFNEYKPLRDKINAAVNQAHNPNLADYAVYFRDVSQGRWVGINENTGYAPASMMKVAIMIAYYKRAEADPALLDKKYAYTNSTDNQISDVPFETPSDLKVGQSYTVDQLIDSMITTSDNGAKNLLLDNIDQSALDEIFTDLGLPNPDITDNYLITPKQYSLLLRILYNATYLSRKYSEKALQLMSQATYRDGLIAGVPQGTAVAQKFGEHVENGGDISLSNCGVIYYPSHPYILCIMTHGNDINSLAETISLISQTAWKEVDTYVKNRK